MARHAWNALDNTEHRVHTTSITSKEVIITMAIIIAKEFFFFSFLFPSFFFSSWEHFCLESRKKKTRAAESCYLIVLRLLRSIMV